MGDFNCVNMLSRLINRTIQPEEEYAVAALTLEEDLLCQSTLQAVAKYIRNG